LYATFERTGLGRNIGKEEFRENTIGGGGGRQNSLFPAGNLYSKGRQKYDSRKRNCLQKGSLGYWKCPGRLGFNLGMLSGECCLGKKEFLTKERVLWVPSFPKEVPSSIALYV